MNTRRRHLHRTLLMGPPDSVFTGSWSRCALSFALSFLMFLAPPRAAPATGRHGIAATGHPAATEAAVQAMQNGGNAIDGAVAAALTLGIVDGHNSGLGGGCFLLIRLADGSVIAIDGREKAPLAA